MTTAHFLHRSLIAPLNPISVNLIGAGGTGSSMLTALGKINYSLIALGAPGLQVTVFDDDIVTEPTVGRQIFAECELGLPKAVALINRVNSFWGSNWKAVTEKFQTDTLEFMPNDGKASIYISCVDSVGARFNIAEALTTIRVSDYDRDKPLYWMDLGNSRYTGQAVLSTIGKIAQPDSEKYQPVPVLPMLTEEFKVLLLSADTGDDTPSCSTAEALLKQDLFINPAIANLGASLLWQLLHEKVIQVRGFFHNIREFKTTPIRL